MSRSATRRDFLKGIGAAGLGMALGHLGCAGSAAAGRKKVIVLGIDGMDPGIAARFMAEGIMPNMSALAASGTFCSVATTMPPQSPVAWSTFAVGAGTETHGIYDFIHRDPLTMAPYLSTSAIQSGNRSIKLGRWQIPLGGPTASILRKGRPFWEHLADRDIPATIFKMPANFPCPEGRTDMVSGMGTPDLRGGYGIFNLLTSDPSLSGRRFKGGTVSRLVLRDNASAADIEGPANPLIEGAPVSIAPVKIWRDPAGNAVRILAGGNDHVVALGEWTEWITISFPMPPRLKPVRGICRMYVKSVHPEITIYVTPVNIDPSDPVFPVFSSAGYGRGIVREVGPFYTQGLPYDTDALSSGALEENEYLELGRYILRERKLLLEYELKRFSRRKTGLLFFYIASLDQNSHMYWRSFDGSHPLYNAGLAGRYGGVLRDLYAEMDAITGRVLQDIDISDPDNAVFVMSDHGFAPFSRQVNLNAWLCEQGFMKRQGQPDPEGYFQGVDWTRTSAYALGINGLYLNLKGRERTGAVDAPEGERICEALRKGILGLTDPETGKAAATAVHRVPAAERTAHPHAPDLIVGWNRGYRTSWEGILGGIAGEAIRGNEDKWSGDHCIDPGHVPAMLCCNRRIGPGPSLADLSSHVLAEFGLKTQEA